MRGIHPELFVDIDNLIPSREYVLVNFVSRIPYLSNKSVDWVMILYVREDFCDGAIACYRSFIYKMVW